MANIRDLKNSARANMKILSLIGSMWIFVTVTQAFPGKRNVNEDARTVLLFCKLRMGIEDCAAQFGIRQTIFQVFRLMTLDPHWVTASCHNDTMVQCLNGCDRQFQASKYGYTLSICTQKDVIRQQRNCWDDVFPEQARLCYNRYYPVHRQEAFYPTPFRAYNLETIARDCFPNEPETCRHYKSYILYHLMPQYYEVYQPPPGF